MGSEVVIRAAARQDCEAIRAIYNHYVLHDTCTWALQPETAAERAAWFDAHGDAHPVFVAEDAGTVIGWASLSPFSSREGYRHTVEDSVYVAPDRRGRGVGAALLARLVETARARGHRTIVGMISADQPASLRLHARFGFVEAGRLLQAGHKFGRWLDDVFVQLVLA